MKKSDKEKRGLTKAFRVNDREDSMLRELVKKEERTESNILRRALIMYYNKSESK